VLDISHNSLSTLSSAVLQELGAIAGLRHLSLAHNPWLCSCTNRALYLWLTGNTSRASDFDVISCQDNRGGRWFISEPQDVEKLFVCDDDDDDNDAVSAAVLVLVFVVLPALALLAFLAYRYRHILTALLYSRLHCHCLKRDAGAVDVMRGERVVYDVCVLYDHSDRKCQWWVENSLLPRLRNLTRPLRVHVPGVAEIGGSRKLSVDWDAMPGGMRRAAKEVERGSDSTVYSVRQSAACLVLVSKYFGSHQHTVVSFAQAMEQAHHHPASLVMVTWGELTKQTLECGVREFLGHSHHLPITAPFFWDRLLFLLPTPQRPLPTMPSFLRRHSQQFIQASRFRSLSDVSCDENGTEFTDVTNHL
jgi:hypothetical protein